MQGDDERRARPTRRDVILAAGASALALPTGAGLTQEPAAARGVVFQDRSGSGLRRAGDPGVGGVMVSNGRDVVLTDTDGRWRLPVSDGDSVFVIKPPHWSVPTGKDGLPRFSHRYRSHGGPQPDRRSDASPATIDFPLARREEDARFEALLLADTQPENDAELAYLRDDIIAPTLGSGAAFAINHGDIVFDDHALYPRYLQMLGASGVAWHHCPGNHDINSDAKDDRTSRETWKRVFGPRHYAFQHANATFIVLDNVYYFGHNPGTATSGRYCGLIGAQQLEFVRNVLAHVPPEQLVVLSMHIPLVNYQEPRNPADNTFDRRALLDLLSSRRHTVSFSGHMHLTEHHYLGLDHGFRGPVPHHHHVLTAASGAWWGGPKDSRGIPSADSQDGTPNGFHMLSVEDNRYTTRFVPAAGKSAGHLRAMVHRPTTAMAQRGALDPHDLAACELVVNVFDGGPASRVTFEISGRNAPPTPLQRRATVDPYIAELFARSRTAQKPWARPVASSHLWKVALPLDLEPGAHCLTVKATDEYRRQVAAHLVLEIADTGMRASRA